MPQSAPIRIPANTWVDVYAASGIAVGTQLTIQVIGSESAIFVDQVSQPSNNTTGFNQGIEGEWIVSEASPAGCWCFSQTGTTIQVGLSFTPYSAGSAQSKSYFAEVSRGNIQGEAVCDITGYNPDVDTGTAQSIWVPGGVIDPPTANEQMEIHSQSAGDTLLGVGARQVFIRYLDSAFAVKTITVDMDGVTWVSLPVSDVYRIIQMDVISVGSGRGNQGVIILRDTVTLAPRSGIYFDASIGSFGANVSQDGTYTVPAGKEAYILGGYVSIGKNKDCRIDIEIDAIGNIPKDRITLRSYQSTIVFDPASPIGPIPVGSDIFPVATTENNNTEVSMAYQIWEVDLQ